MNPLTGSGTVNPISISGVVVLDEIWIKIISIIFESNSTLPLLMDNPCKLVCKTFYRLSGKAFGSLSQLPFLFYSPSGPPPEGPKMEVGNYLTPIHCDQKGNRYFRSQMIQTRTELLIFRVNGDVDTLILTDAFDPDQYPNIAHELTIFNCTRHEDTLIVVSLNRITLFQFDTDDKIVLEEDADGEKWPKLLKSISTEHAGFSNIFFYQNRLFWRNRVEEDDKFFMCDLSKEQLVWEELELKDTEASVPYHATFMTLKGDLYLSYTLNKKLEDTCTIQTTNFYIRLNYDAENNTLTPSGSFSTTSTKPFYSSDKYYQILNRPVEGAKKDFASTPGFIHYDHRSEIKEMELSAIAKAEADKYTQECKAANKSDYTASFVDSRPHSEHHLCPNNQRWMVDVRQHKLQVIDLESTNQWIGSEANILSPDPLMQEMVFLDNNFLLVSYSNSFRAFYLPTRTELTGRFRSFLKPFLKKGYAVLSVTFKKELEEEKQVTTVCLQQIKTPRTAFTLNSTNYDKPGSQEVITMHFTLREADLLKEELLTEREPPKIEDPIEEFSIEEALEEPEKEPPVERDLKRSHNPEHKAAKNLF